MAVGVLSDIAVGILGPGGIHIAEQEPGLREGGHGKFAAFKRVLHPFFYRFQSST